MSGTERRVSATEARVRFGELLDGVTARHDVVFVKRAGKEVAVVVSVEDWEAACAGRSDKWARANAMLAEYHERLRAEGAIERLKDFNVGGRSVSVGTTGMRSVTAGCIDASLVVRILGGDSAAVAPWERLIQSGGELIAPSLLPYEVANVLHQQQRVTK